MTPPERIKQLVRTMMDRADKSYPDQAHQIWGVWCETVGEDVARRTQPLTFYRGKLTVGVSSAPWLQQLQLLSEQMMDSINRALGAKVVISLRFRVTPVEPLPAPAAKQTEAPWADLMLPDVTLAQIDAALAPIEDPELRQSIRQARIMAEQRRRFTQAQESDAPLPNTSPRRKDHEE